MLPLELPLEHFLVPPSELPLVLPRGASPTLSRGCFWCKDLPLVPPLVLPLEHFLVPPLELSLVPPLVHPLEPPLELCLIPLILKTNWVRTEHFYFIFTVLFVFCLCFVCVCVVFS